MKERTAVHSDDEYGLITFEAQTELERAGLIYADTAMRLAASGFSPDEVEATYFRTRY